MKTLKCAKVEKFRQIPGTEFELKAELVLLAMGFVHMEHGPLVKDMGSPWTSAATSWWTGTS